MTLQDTIEYKCSPLGMLEYWSNGIMGSGITDVVLFVRRRIERKINNRIPSFYNPAFQYSIIPLFHDRGKYQGRIKIFYIIKL
jgi:hypothetical protein